MSVEYWRGLEIWVRDRSKSLKVPFESLGTVSYSHSVATMAASSAVSTQYATLQTLSQPPADTIVLQQRLRLCIASRGKNGIE